MRVSIDSDVCIGSGQCALSAPSVFTVDQDGFGAVLPGGQAAAGTDPGVRVAAGVCPVQAVTLTEDH